MEALSIIKNDISTTTFTSNKAFGSKGGHGFSLVGWTESPISKMTLHVGKTFGRIVVEKYDGTSINFGGAPVRQPEYRQMVWKLEKDDLLSKIELYSNGSVLAAIRLTVRGRSAPLEACIDGFSIAGSKPEQRMEVPPGTGKFVGVYGNHDMSVQSLGLAMLRN